ncbi:MAG: oligosaccharide flippase family protein [Hyphomonas sp.]|uniref:oligosaccharide flippase family protein n=1 Tax=Hyphomonas sp. TaxID=87 RepID=UPI0035289D92
MAPALMRRAGQAIVLTALANWLGMIGGIVSLIFVARMISPSDFGHFGMVLAIMALPDVLTSGSLNEVIIQRRDLKSGHINSVFVQSLLFAGVFWGCIQLGAPWISRALGQPEIAQLLQVFSIALFLGALLSLPAALLQRDLKYREITLIDVLGTLTAAVVGIVLAHYLRNAWALVGMELSRRTVRTIGFVTLARWFPSFQFTWDEMRDLTRFNAFNAMTKIIAAIEAAAPRGLIGMFLGPAALGMFNIASRFLDQARLAFVAPFSAIALPVASQIQDDLPTLHRAMEGATRLASLIAYPTFIGGAAIAPAAVPLMFGPQWQGAVQPIQIMMLMGLRAPAFALNAGVLKSIGQVSWLLRISFASTALAVASVAITLPFSLNAVIWAIFLQQTLIWILSAAVLQNLIHYPMRRQILAGTTALIAALLMGGVVLFGGSMISPEVAPTAKLLTLIGLGGVSYVIFLVALDFRSAKIVSEALSLIVRGRAKEALQIARKLS